MMQNIDYYIGDIVFDKDNDSYLVVGIGSESPEEKPINYFYFLLFVNTNSIEIPEFFIKTESEETLLKNYTKSSIDPLYNLSDDYLCHDGRCGIKLCELCDYKSIIHNTVLVGDIVYSKRSKQNYIINLISALIIDPKDNITPTPALVYNKKLGVWVLNCNLFQLFRDLVCSVILEENYDFELKKAFDSVDGILYYVRKQITEVAYYGTKQITTLIYKEHYRLIPENFNRVSRGGLFILNKAQLSYICNSCIYKDCKKCETNNIKKMLWKKVQMS